MHWIYLIHEFHNLSWITEINELFHDILIYWDAPVFFLVLSITLLNFNFIFVFSEYKTYLNIILLVSSFKNVVIFVLENKTKILRKKTIFCSLLYWKREAQTFCTISLFMFYIKTTRVWIYNSWLSCYCICRGQRGWKMLQNMAPLKQHF